MLSAGADVHKEVITMQDQKQQIYDLLYDIVGEGGCGVACTEDELYREDGEWKLNLCGFMEPWTLGKNLEEVETTLRDYANQGFGMRAKT
jgi:hypothetical protein